MYEDNNINYYIYDTIMKNVDQSAHVEQERTIVDTAINLCRDSISAATEAVKENIDQKKRSEVNSMKDTQKTTVQKANEESKKKRDKGFYMIYSYSSLSIWARKPRRRAIVYELCRCATNRNIHGTTSL